MDSGSLRRNYQWYGFGVLWAGAFILALVGFARYSAWHRLAYSIWDQLYLAL